MILRPILIIVMLVLPFQAIANDKLVRVFAPETLVETGLLKHILPRFSLKTQVRVEFTTIDSADLALGDAGKPAFQGPNQVWKLDVLSPDHLGTKRLVDWMLSEVGQRTIASFAPDGVALFGAPQATVTETVEVALDGDAVLGHKVSRTKCARCHGVDEATKGWGIGSTPSFGVLRALDDWEDRFAAFFVLNPHPAFTQIEDITEPFPIDRPSPIAPVELTLDELEALLAYVSAMDAADLGKPIEHQ